MATLKIDDVMQAKMLNDSIKDTAALINEEISSINAGFDSLLTAHGLGDDKVVQRLASSIREKIVTIQKNIKSDLDIVYGFMEGQFIDYDTIFSEANRLLVSALEQINTKFPA